MENKRVPDQELENISGGSAFEPQFYVVKPGDTLSTLPKKLNISLEKLKMMNPKLKESLDIKVGDLIRVR